MSPAGDDVPMRRPRGRAAAGGVVLLLACGMGVATMLILGRSGDDEPRRLSIDSPVVLPETTRRPALPALEAPATCERACAATSLARPRGTVAGEVRTTWGAPLAAEITLTVTRRGNAPEEHRLTADEDGRFVREGIEGDVVAVAVVAASEGHASMRAESGPLSGDAWRFEPRLELPLAGNVLVHGLVVDPEGEPWDEAALRRCFSPSGAGAARDDFDGTRGDLRAEDAFGIWAVEGRSPDRERSRPARLDPASAAFTFEAPLSADGEVVALAQGAVLARASYSAAREPVRLVVDGPALEARTGGLVVRVLGTDTASRATSHGAEVRLCGARFFADADARFERVCAIDRDGIARFDALLEGPYVVRLSCAAFADVARDVTVRARETTELSLEASLPVTFELRLAVEPDVSPGLARSGCVTYRDLGGHRLACRSEARWDGDELVVRIGGVPSGPGYAVIGRNALRVDAVAEGTWRATLRPKAPIRFRVGSFGAEETGRSFGVAVRLLADGVVPVVDDTTLFVTVDESGFGEAHLMAPAGEYRLEIDAGRGPVSVPVRAGAEHVAHVDIGP